MKNLLFICTFLFVSFINPTENLTFAHNHTTQEPIRGIYVRAVNTSGPRFSQLLSLVNHSELNTMVIDLKDDEGRITYLPSKSSPYYSASRPFIKDPSSLIKTLNANHVYPIARIVVFKDNQLANAKPEWSFRTQQGVWKSKRGESFTNPFVKEVWDYNIGVAIEAAKLGFKEIQFDYIRFPEKFETFEDKLIYKKVERNDNRERVSAITSFIQYASQQLKPYHVKVSADTFGNTTVIPEAQGIGQNFSEIAQNVDIISAMIYPSHWTKIYGINKPDLHPYQLVKEYAKAEKSRLVKVSPRPASRPWIQDFSATWLGKGNYQVYGKKQVEEQIRALHSEGIEEYLLWNSQNLYSQNVDYTPYHP